MGVLEFLISFFSITFYILLSKLKSLSISLYKIIWKIVKFPKFVCGILNNNIVSSQDNDVLSFVKTLQNQKNIKNQKISKNIKNQANIKTPKYIEILKNSRIINNHKIINIPKETVILNNQKDIKTKKF